VRRRIDQIYMDKVDGKISEDFWQRKTAEWQLEEQQVLMAMQGLEQASPDMLLTAKWTLELANKACFLYVTQNPAEQGTLLKKVLLNCRVDGVSLYPTYRKPFDLIFNRAKNHEWSGREDLNLRPPGPERHRCQPSSQCMVLHQSDRFRTPCLKLTSPGFQILVRSRANLTGEFLPANLLMN